MSTDLKYWYLHEHHLFDALNASEINQLCIMTRMNQTKRSETVNLPYSEKSRVYILKKGILKLIKRDQNGNETLIDIINQGDLFGELSLDNTTNTDEHVLQVVSEEAIICAFYSERLEELMIQKPHFAVKYAKHIGSEYKKFQNSYKNIFFKEAKTRLLLLLLHLMDDTTDTHEYQLPSYLTQKDIAHLICTTRQTVINLTKQLHDEGIISYSDANLSIPDVKKFKEIVRKLT